ncbi:hypothetical protein OJJOAM_000704 [Cupriavidus sp. H18C1]|uniref:hypothetical protein n=1 Tax=Cupriavidus sp. H18C1 TaxID=3241601 RepID=UPI003BB8C717
MNGSGCFVFEAVDAEHHVMRQSTADGDLRPSMQSVLHDSRGMEPPKPVRGEPPPDEASDFSDDDGEERAGGQPCANDVAERESAPLADIPDDRAPIPDSRIAAAEPRLLSPLGASWIMIPGMTT